MPGHDFRHFRGKTKGMGKSHPRKSTRKQRKQKRGTHENKYRPENARLESRRAEQGEE